MRRFLVFAVVLATMTPSAFAAFVDTFDRPDSDNMGPDWTETLGQFRISGNRAQSGPEDNDYDLMVVNGVSSTNPVLSVDAYMGEALSNVGLLSLFRDNLNHVNVNVFDSDSNGTFDRVSFIREAFHGESWGAMTGGPSFQDVSSFSQARLTTRIVGDSVTLHIDRDFDGVPEDTLTRGGIPLNFMGTGVGVAGWYRSTLDNFTFNVPEPSTVALVACGALVTLVRWRPGIA